MEECIEVDINNTSVFATYNKETLVISNKLVYSMHVSTVAWSGIELGSILAIGLADSTLTIWNRTTNMCHYLEAKFDSPLVSIQFTNPYFGSYIVAASSSYVYVLRHTTGVQLYTYDIVLLINPSNFKTRIYPAFLYAKEL